MYYYVNGKKVKYNQKEKRVGFAPSKTNQFTNPLTNPTSTCSMVIYALMLVLLVAFIYYGYPHFKKWQTKGKAKQGFGFDFS